MFAVYGAIAELIVGGLCKQGKTLQEWNDTAYSMLMAWGAMNFGFDAIYILLGGW